MAQLVSSKNLLLSTRPLTVGVASQPEALAAFLSQSLEERKATCDLVELRLDLLELDADELQHAIPLLGLPVLLTARHPAEGGRGTEDAAGRKALLEPLINLAAIVDIELRSMRDMQDIMAQARRHGVSVMGSFHDFQVTPGEEVLRGVTDLAQTTGLDAVKLATYLNGPDDLMRLMKLVSDKRRMPMSVMGMGGLGRVSRLALAKLGSLLNYGYLGEANAPGQWPSRQLKDLLNDL
ncbi:MAG: quiB [Verrucomicrobiaceae bacterium]|nr:quiB [Verrucomicrobiaceae bacterium]